MTKLLLSGIATIAFAATSATSFAQDQDWDDKPATDKPAVEMAETDEMESDAPEMESEEDMSDTESDMDDEAEDTSDMMDDEAEVEKADCPEGTESQDDGTCVASDDWAPEE